MEKNETPKEAVADIVAEMRGNPGIPVPFAPMNAVWVEDFKAYADRIDAAWKRERQAYLGQIRDAVNMIGHEKHVAEHSQKPPVGNAAAIKQAFGVRGAK